MCLWEREGDPFFVGVLVGDVFGQPSFWREMLPKFLVCLHFSYTILMKSNTFCFRILLAATHRVVAAQFRAFLDDERDEVISIPAY